MTLRTRLPGRLLLLCATTVSLLACSGGSSGSAASTTAAATTAATTTGQTAGGTPALRAVVIPRALLGGDPSQVEVRAYAADLTLLRDARLEVDLGGGWVAATGTPTTYRFSDHNSVYTGSAGFLSYVYDQAAQRYRVTALRGGQRVASTTVEAPQGVASGSFVTIQSPSGAHDWHAPPVVATPPGAAWSAPGAAVSLVTLMRVESLSSPPNSVLDALVAESVVETTGTTHLWGAAASKTWVAGRASLPAGRYALEVLLLDATGFCLGSSYDHSRSGLDIHYRFDVQ